MSVCSCFGYAEIAKYDEEYQFLYIQCTKCGKWYAVRTVNLTPTDPPKGFEDIEEEMD